MKASILFMQECLLKVVVDGNKIIGQIDGASGSVEYAFYLKKEGLKIKTRWYSDEPICDFFVPAGLYQVIGFVKEENSAPLILESEFVRVCDEQNEKRSFSLKDYTISIFGSCVSRDLLEYDKDNNFVLANYFARCSVVSAVSNPIKVVENEINLSSPFQRRMVASDLDKRVWNVLKERKSDYLLVDFIDERFQIGTNMNSYFTMSNEMIESKYILASELLNKVEIEGSYYVDGLCLEAILTDFWKRILAIYSADKIILHKARMTDYYYDDEQVIKKFDGGYLKNNAKINKLLDYMYDFSEKFLQNCISISVVDACLASYNHKWGLAPMHYVDDYYNKVLEIIDLKIKE